MTGNSPVLAVAGAGAAGMMAAISAARSGARVVLIDPNEKVGRKLYITGKGRCNVTNSCDIQTVMVNIPRNGKFLYSSLDRFAPADTIAFFEAMGVPLKVERGNRVFPVSDKAADIVDALFYELRRLKVERICDRVTGLIVQDGRLSGVRLERGGALACGALVLATGGASYPGTGSTGDGYRLAREAGHEIVPIRGSLVPLESSDPDCGRLQGLSLRNVELKVRDQKGKVVYREQGELLFTHFGLSGPIVLSASAHLDFSKNSYTAHIDLKPALDEQTLDRRLLRDFEERANQDFDNALGGLVPRSMIPVLTDRTGISGDTKVRDIRREQRARLLSCLKDFSVALGGTRPVEEAIITAGGVKVSQVDPKSMQSKLVKGLYIAGELLDLDAYTGGFNLQIAWCTGRAAGLAAAEQLAKERMDMPRSIAIDGPSGAGKSTLAKRLAETLGFCYVDTGAIYRTVGLFTLREGVDPEDAAGVEALLGRIDVRMAYGADGLQHMYLNGEDVTSAIRENQVSSYASKVSAIPAVRAFLLEMQRKSAREQDVIMDGRDIGTVVLPEADVKIFLTASAEARADRRYRELVERGQTVDRDEILREVLERDDRDSHRAAAPLKQAKDAVVVDTTELDLEGSFRQMLDVIQAKLGTC